MNFQPNSFLIRDNLTSSTIISDGQFNELILGNIDTRNQNLSNMNLSKIETELLKSTKPLEVNESDEITVNGQRGLWLNKEETIHWRGPIPLDQYSINQDPNPEVIIKPNQQKVEYVHEIAIRYLRPPTPPSPGEIIITQVNTKSLPPAPPLIIRQQPPRPSTPEPLIIREAPPPLPAPVGRKIITIGGKHLPPPPRKVIIERLPSVPSKPQSIIVERWLPYSKLKRRVIYNRENRSEPIIMKPKNVIIQWDPPQVKVKRDLKFLGVIKANPNEYIKRFGPSLVYPNNLPQFVKDISPPEGVVLASNVRNDLNELEGDVQALKFVDLDREGLSEYKPYLKQIGVYSENQMFFDNSNKTDLGMSNITNIIIKPNQNPVSKYIERVEITEEVKPVVQNTQPEPPISSNEMRDFSDNDAIDTLIEFIFKTMDRHSNGRISVAEAEKLLLRLNSRLDRQFNEESIKLFLNEIVIGDDGSIDLKEFKRAFLNLITIE